MDMISMIAERKNYYIKQSFISKTQEELDEYKVWEIKNDELLGDIINQVERRDQRRKRERFFYVFKAFTKFMRYIENVIDLYFIQL